MTTGAARKVDARTQSRAQLLERRRQVIQLHQQGLPVMQIVTQTGLHWATVNSAIKLHKAQGESALMPSARGRKQGTGRSLNPDQEAQIRYLILVRRPRSYKLTDALWTRDTVARLIEQKVGVKLSVRGLSNYLTRWCLALPIPSKRPQARCSAEVQRWMATKFPEVERDASDREGEIYWINKPVPLTPELWHNAAGTRDLASNSIAGHLPAKKRWMVSAVNRQGTLRWAIVNGTFNAKRQITFVTALLKDTIGRREIILDLVNGAIVKRKKPLLLIRSDQSVCRSQEFMSWIKHNKAEIKIFPN